MPDRTVLVQPLWRLRSGARYLIDNPPEGYCFVANDDSMSMRLNSLASVPLSYNVQWLLNSYLPLNLLKSYANRITAKRDDIDLVYSVMGLWQGDEPWVLDMEAEQPHLLLGHERPFRWFRPLLLNALRGENCRRIVCWVDSIEHAFLEWLDYDETVAEKIEVVYWAVPRKEFVKRYDNSKVVIRFVDSAHINTALNFHIKGGKEVLEAFVRLRQRYDNVELVMRTAMPKEIAARYADVPGLRIIDKVLPWEGLEQLWQQADIFVHADHATPGTVYIDAMSYELPIVTTDVLGNRFLIDEGQAGLLVSKRQVDSYIDGYRLNFTSPNYRKTLMTLDNAVVDGLVDKLSLLIENAGLRRAMGRSGRYQTEEGRFSQTRRNAQLKRILDEALQGAQASVRV